jgi:hypothetical protein
MSHTVFAFVFLILGVVLGMYGTSGRAQKIGIARPENPSRDNRHCASARYL